MAGLIGLFRQIEAAQDQARALRAQYGPLAEDHCRRELASLEKCDARRPLLRDVLKALPWIPAETNLRGH
jgi:hypothetical protein